MNFKNHNIKPKKFNIPTGNIVKPWLEQRISEHILSDPLIRELTEKITKVHELASRKIIIKPVNNEFDIEHAVDDNSLKLISELQGYINIRKVQIIEHISKNI